MTGAGGPVPRGPSLLFDRNLVPGLARRLADLSPGSAHVRDVGLAAADGEVVWAHALAGGWVIVTNDDDFRQRSFVLRRLAKGDLGEAWKLHHAGRRRCTTTLPLGWAPSFLTTCAPAPTGTGVTPHDVALQQTAHSRMLARRSPAPAGGAYGSAQAVSGRRS